MMNVLRTMFGVCSSSAEKGEVHDTVRRVFGNDMVLKDNTDRHTQRSKYVSHIRENLPKMLETKAISHTPKKSGKKHSVTPIAAETPETDDRPGRVGPKIVVFDATTGTGRLVLVGDERVSVQGLSSFATIRATACVFAGRWMYEVQLGTKGIMQIGWCTAHCMFSMDTGVGDTSNSYAYDGGRVRRWNVATSPYGQAWLPGDVIGSCIDLDKGTLEYYRNGISMGVAFDKVAHGSGVAYFPAVSLAMQEHLYANFGHVPFVFPVEAYNPLQAAPYKECARTALLFKYVDSLLEELAHLSDLKPPAVTTKSSKTKSESSKTAEEEVALRIHSNEAYSPRASPHAMANTQNAQNPPNAQNAQNTEVKKMSKKAFLTSLARIVVVELGNTLRLSYVVVSELLPRFRAHLGLRTRGFSPDQHSLDFYTKCIVDNFNDLSSKFLAQPQPRLCTLLDLLWTFLDESAVCDMLEHCVVRECLMFDVVSPDMNFTQQIEGVYVLSGLMQHRDTRHHLVKYVFFNKITFDNFLNVKCPDDSVLRTVIRKPWWQRPTAVHGETDPRIAEMTEKGTIKKSPFAPTMTDKISKILPAPDDSTIEAQYREDCEKITKAIEPLEHIQLEFLLMLLDNSDGTNMVPSTRKIFLEKFKRYIMDNCILDMRLFNISRNSPAISWCCHARLLTAVLKLFAEHPIGNPHVAPHLPPRTFIDGELDFYNVDRLGGVLPFLVRTLRQDLISVLGEDNPFIQSFEPSYNRAGGIDTGVSDMAAGSPGLATLPQVISSMARFMHPQMPPMPNRSTGETALALKGARSMMPGAGAIDVRSAHLRLLDGLLALYHGAAIKHAEKLCELRDNQLDMADCLHDIEYRIYTVTAEMKHDKDTKKELTEQDLVKKKLMEKILSELERSKAIYEEKLEASALNMGWVIGAIWTKQRQMELAKHFAGALHSLRLASDNDYAAHIQVASKEILPGKSSLIGASYASLQLEYTSSSDQSPQSPTSRATTPRIGSNAQFGGQSQDYADSLFAFVPEYHVDAMLELCNTLRLYMHPTVPVVHIPDWDELVVSCASFLCAEFADSRIVLASTRESLVQTLASFATQQVTMRAIERVPLKQQMSMIEELIKPYQNRAWAQSNWVLVRFWHGSGFGFRHRQWPHLAARYGDREPTVNNLGAKVDAGLMSQCFGPCPSEVIQSRIREYLELHPKEAASFLNSLLSQLNWAFSEFITMMQEMDRVSVDAHLESRQIKLCATCFDLYHGLARALEMCLYLAPTLLSKPEASDNQNELLLGRTCQMLMAVISRVCVRGGGGSGFARLVQRGLPDTDRVHYYVALAPVAGCLIRMLDPKLAPEHLEKITKALVTEPLFHPDGLEFMLGKNKPKQFSFYKYPEDVTHEEMKALEIAVDRLKVARDNMIRSRSPGGSSGAQSDLLCTICYARPADTGFVPCGHHSCRACIMQHLLNSKQCFFCKAEIESVKEIEPAANN
ncbi:E3 ubiquitin-protein ligase RNF123-like isoform X2 [Plodia interpunctella]|uniref:E3 ubiquitin-protein ligase RNF123-like isoform X2 n=1 Tax=Plodia interpunctella TaxID=58824 RepID=UPI002367D595|nr:E3 ubiquitin-protein ligase RNF123-like isoform X2 [Plodia interpunctella]